MELSEAEHRLKFTLPLRHRQAILDLADPRHRACDFLTLSDNKPGNIHWTNEFLRSSKFGDPWPDFLIAFASNGCGDYCAYDTRDNPPSIIYIDPDSTVQENLQASDKLCYESFENWYESEVAPLACQGCGSPDARFEASHDKKWLLRICPACGFQERAIAVDT